MTEESFESGRDKATHPTIAVLMAAYNAEKTIRRAVDSVRASVVPVDIYIVDDGSKVPVADFLGKPVENVFIHRLTKNRGLPTALNIGLKIILDKNYDFVARFDADDYSYPERFLVQFQYLETHPEVQVAGCWVRIWDERASTTLFTLRHPELHTDIVKAMYYNSAFVHPTLFFRADALRALDHYYDATFRLAQDYELMARVVRKFRTANVPQVLLNYSYLSEISSKKKRRRQLRNRFRVQLMHFSPVAVHAWLGLLKTAGLFLIPMRTLTWLKQRKENMSNRIKEKA